MSELQVTDKLPANIGEGTVIADSGGIKVITKNEYSTATSSISWEWIRAAAAQLTKATEAQILTANEPTLQKSR